MEVTHLFLDADNPTYYFGLPLSKAYGVLATEVSVVERGTTPYEDEVQFVHYVRRL